MEKIIKAKEIFSKFYDVEILFVKEKDRQKVLDMGAIYNPKIEMFILSKDQDKKPFSKYIKESNPNPIYREMNRNITNDDFREKVETYLANRGLYIGTNELYEEDSSKWINVFREGSKNAKGGFKVLTNKCTITEQIEPYKNVLLLNDWVNGDGMVSLSANDLYEDKRFIPMQIGIAMHGNKKNLYSLSKEDKEMYAIYKQYEKAKTVIHEIKKDLVELENNKLFELGKEEVFKTFTQADNEIEKIKSHPYVLKKNIPKEYLTRFRIDGNTLLIPLLKGGITSSDAASLVNIQRIFEKQDSDKQKETVKLYGVGVSKEHKSLGVEKYNTTTKGIYFIATKDGGAKTLKELNTNRPFIIVEGVSTGIFLSKAIEECTGEPCEVVCAMSIGGIKSLLEEIKKKDPEMLKRVIVSGDNDEYKTYRGDEIIPKKNVGRANSEKYCEEYGVKMLLPDFSFMSKENLLKYKPSDWDDLYKLPNGKENMYSQLKKVYKQENSSEYLRTR